MKILQGFWKKVVVVWCRFVHAELESVYRFLPPTQSSHTLDPIPTHPPLPLPLILSSSPPPPVLSPLRLSPPPSPPRRWRRSPFKSVSKKTLHSPRFILSLCPTQRSRRRPVPPLVARSSSKKRSRGRESTRTLERRLTKRPVSFSRLCHSSARLGEHQSAFKYPPDSRVSGGDCTVLCTSQCIVLRAERSAYLIRSLLTFVFFSCRAQTDAKVDMNQVSWTFALFSVRVPPYATAQPCRSTSTAQSSSHSHSSEAPRLRVCSPSKPGYSDSDRNAPRWPCCFIWFLTIPRPFFPTTFF